MAPIATTLTPLERRALASYYSKLSPPAKPPPAALLQPNDVILGRQGQGQTSRDGRVGFPSLSGSDSFNWGAGMAQLGDAAAVIRANMRFWRGGLLSEQQAWDVAMYIDSQERPQDPRFTGSVAEPRARFHGDSDSMYGSVVNGHVLGSNSDPPGGRRRQPSGT